MKRDVPLSIYFSDNDPTKHGRILQGRDIIPPAELNPRHDLVVITSISAGYDISEQLEQLNFTRDINYFEVMQHLDYTYPPSVIDFYLKYIKDFFGLDILHIGPGGDLGVELLLDSLGAKTVTAIEYNSFNLKYPDVSDIHWYYRKIAQLVSDRGGEDLFSGKALIEKGSELHINQDKIKLIFPCSITDTPFPSNSFDLVLHHAVFEHVQNPDKGYNEIFRILKTGGKTIGLVDPQDHRVFSSFAEYHPLKFLEYHRNTWHQIAKK